MSQAPLTLVEKGRFDRALTVTRMAEHLLRLDAFRTESDAMRSLLGNGFGISDIVLLVDDARQMAMQAVVAAEMSKP